MPMLLTVGLFAFMVALICVIFGRIPGYRVSRWKALIVAALSIGVIVMGSRRLETQEASRHRLESQSQDVAAKFKQHLRENFTGTIWFGNIQALAVRLGPYGSTISVNTAVYPDDEGKSVGKRICGAVAANYVIGGYRPELKQDSVTVDVWGAGYRSLASCER